MSTCKVSRLNYLLHGLFLIVLLLSSGCTFSVTRYSDGSLTEYLKEPIPRLHEPIAQTLSLEKVTFLTSAGFEAIMISDMVAQEIYILPEDVGHEVKAKMNLDKEYSKEATYQALNILARNRTEARHAQSGATSQAVTTTNISSAATESYIKRQESMAKQAYKKGDYLGGDIHNSAATNTMRIDQSFGQAQAAVGATFAVLNSLAVVGEALIKSEFISLRNWIEFESGAIGEQAPKGSHLSLFYLRFFDAESFQLESRTRVAVFMVLTDSSGKTISVLEGSDILVCEGECNLFLPKPTARVFEEQTLSADVQQLWGPDGHEYLSDSGFDAIGGIYQYLLLQHGLHKLSK
jgi:hypothetical protein